MTNHRPAGPQLPTVAQFTSPLDLTLANSTREAIGYDVEARRRLAKCSVHHTDVRGFITSR